LLIEKLIINLALTGLIPTKDMTPHIPIAPEEIVEDVKKCSELGVSIVHIHARDAAGQPSCSTEYYKRITEGIRRLNRDIIICASTSGRFSKSFEERSAVLDLKDKHRPDMASLTLSSLNFNHEASINSPDTIQSLAKKMLDAGIKPELEVFDCGMINYSKYLIKKGLLKPPYYYNLLFGNIACMQANPMSLGMAISELPAESIWSAAGIGDFQLTMNSLGIICGGGVRTGLEDNIWYDSKRTRLATNYDLVKRVVDIAKVHDREIATPREVREILHL
jgi:3-keto-5-aminohexanoate cleavage enzyme